MILLACGFVLVASLAAATALHAQQRPDPQIPAGMTTEQILRRLRDSGLTRAQVRDRLRAAGYDPNLADRYFDELERPDSARAGAALTRAIPQPSGSLLEALQRAGILQPGTPPAAPAVNAPVRADTARPRPRPLTPAVPQVFGSELFSATTTEFQAVVEGPVDPGYLVGPGDQITLIVTGDVELAYNLEVTREGYIVVPDVGQVNVAGLTVEQMRARLNERLGRVYSGIRVGTTDFDLSMGRLRRNLVWMVGEVNLPGAVSVSGGATVFNALYQSGGPNNNGSYRRIEVRRNNRVVRAVDIYDYLLSGDKSGDIRLEQGDVVFVPIVGPQVTVDGNVRRPAIFELKGNESLADVLRFAGGTQAQAALERIQIDRILPAGQRRPGMDRTLVDVSLNEIQSARRIPLYDGDRITVFAISTERRNRVTVTGDVFRPGTYEFRPGMTVQDLVSLAQGLSTTAYRPAAHVVRLSPADSSTRLIPVQFQNAQIADHAANVRLEDLDRVVIFSRAQLAIPATVEVFGEVKSAGSFTFSEGMTVRDIVLLAGGFREGALRHEVEVARRVPGTANPDSMARVFRVPLNLQLQGDDERDRESRFALEPGDQVFVRKLPGFTTLQTLEVTGEVKMPGRYTVGSRRERISDILTRAGGLTAEAYAPGFQLVRGGRLVGVNLAEALRERGGSHDLIVEPEDRLNVPSYDPTVLVLGAVGFETRVRYQRGLGVDDYVNRAGGFRNDADEGRVSVRYPNGELRSTSSFLGFDRDPRVQPGSVITVPTKPEVERVNWEQVLSRTLSVVSTLATLIVAVRAIN